MNNITAPKLLSMKQNANKISAIALYDASMAAVFNAAGIEVILVGDSVGMTVQGRNDTVAVSMDEMCYHTRCVARGNQQALLIGDLPFMSYTSVEQALTNATRLMQAGAQMIKLETTAPIHVDIVAALTQHQVPVCSHIGLTPQSVHALGGHRVQGKQADAAAALLDLAKSLDQAGSSAIVLECIPANLADNISKQINAATIGIGSGPHCDGQILVSYDMLGISTREKPYKFVRQFLGPQHPSILQAAQAYVAAVKSGDFPNQHETLAE